MTDVEVALRSTANSTTGFSPYEVIFGNKMRTNIFSDWDFTHIDMRTPYIPLNKWDTRLKELHEIVKKNIIYNAEKMKVKDKVRKDLKIGDMVMVEMLGIRRNPLDVKYEGPFRITKVINEVSYELQNNCGKKIIRHRDHIKPTLLPFRHHVQESVISDSNLESQNSGIVIRPQRKRQPVLRYGFS